MTEEDLTRIESMDFRGRPGNIAEHVRVVLVDHNKALVAEIRRLRKALQFYAYKRTWENHHFDLGEIARDALEGK